LAVRRRIIVREHDFVPLPDFQAEADVIAFAAVDSARFDLGLEQDIAGVEIADPHPPGAIALGQENTAAIIEVVPHAAGADRSREIASLGKAHGTRSCYAPPPPPPLYTSPPPHPPS